MKSVFITGGSSGIGLALAKSYLSDGYRVGICGRDKNKFLGGLGETNKEILFYQADVSKKKEIENSIKDFCSMGSLDILICNAGIGYSHKSKDPDFSMSKKIYDINLYGVHYTIESAYPYLVRQESSQIVIISSLAGFNGLPGVSAYSASKAAVRMMAETFHIDLKKRGIHVTCINPGYVRTPLTDQNPHFMPFLMEPEVAVKRMRKAIKAKRMTYSFPKRLYSVVLFLSLIPRPLYRKIMGISLFNFSKD